MNFNKLIAINLVGATCIADAVSVAAPDAEHLEAMQDAWEQSALEEATRNRASVQARRARVLKPWQVPVRR